MKFLWKEIKYVRRCEYATRNDYSNFTLTGQFGSTVKAVNELTAVSVEEVRPGVFVYDMGQNMAGVPKISCRA